MTKPIQTIPIPIPSPPPTPPPQLAPYPIQAEPPNQSPKLKWPILQFRPAVVVVLVGHFPAADNFSTQFWSFFWGRGLGSSASPVMERRRRRGRREWAQFAPHRLFFLFFGAFLNGLFMRGRSIIHTLFKIETERARQRERVRGRGGGGHRAGSVGLAG